MFLCVYVNSIMENLPDLGRCEGMKITARCGTHPLGTYRNTRQRIRTLRIIRGINPNTLQVFF